MPRTNLGNLLHNARKYAGLTLDRLAEVSGVARSRICAIEGGATPNPSSEVLASLVWALNVDAREALNCLLPADVSPRPVPAPRVILSLDALAAAAAVVEQDRANIAQLADATLVRAIVEALADADSVQLSVHIPPPAGAFDTSGRLVTGWDKLPT